MRAFAPPGPRSRTIEVMSATVRLTTNLIREPFRPSLTAWESVKRPLANGWNHFRIATRDIQVMFYRPDMKSSQHAPRTTANNRERHTRTFDEPHLADNDLQQTSRERIHANRRVCCYYWKISSSVAAVSTRSDHLSSCSSVARSSRSITWFGSSPPNLMRS